ncbi:MAG: hypothetical protein F4018_07790 [Acidobacteria bacterium]|nr:hypothetical protein [Acidobacteriota bacterium]MYH31150.1 hypothetical protein [Acidobacteriota bacterium]MYK88242.1 hypothetical protein [Acidobacteriota bacterium]
MISDARGRALEYRHSYRNSPRRPTRSATREVERDLISERTREGLAKARASGRRLGRSKGALGVSRLNGKEDEVRRFIKLRVSKTAIAKITGVSVPRFTAS